MCIEPIGRRYRMFKGRWASVSHILAKEQYPVSSDLQVILVPVLFLKYLFKNLLIISMRIFRDPRSAEIAIRSAVPNISEVDTRISFEYADVTYPNSLPKAVSFCYCGQHDIFV